MEKESGGRLPGLIVVVGMAMLGALAAFGGVLIVTHFEQRGRWVEWARPPRGVTGLVTAHEDYVVVETGDGDLYRVTCRAEPGEDDCWQEIDTTPEDLMLPCRAQEMAPPPEGTREHLETCFEYEFIIRTQYALLEDGTLWRWQVGSYPLGQVARMFRAVIGGLMVGVLAGIGVLMGRK